MTINCAIFDIDGTLADCSHRLQWLSGGKKNWPAFNKGMIHDTVHEDIVWLLKTLHNAGCKILIASGRGEDDRNITEYWLKNVAGIDGLYEKLYMRAAKDNRPDNIVKSEILDQMRIDGFNPTMCVDDRDVVCLMWRERGLRCLQVAPGNF